MSDDLLPLSRFQAGPSLAPMSLQNLNKGLIMVLRKLLLFMVSLTFTQLALAMENWNQGVRYIFSGDSSSEYIIKVDLDSNGMAQLVTQEGSSLGQMMVVGDKLDLVLSQPVSSISYPFKMNPATGHHEQVEQVSELLKIQLAGDEGFAQVTESWRHCIEFQLNGGATEQTCENEEKTMDRGLILREELPKKAMNLSSGDQVVFPLLGMDAIYVQLNQNHQAKVLSSGSEFKAQGISHWEVSDDNFAMSFDDGSQMTYQITQSFEGLDRVVGTFKGNGEVKVFMGALVLDKKIKPSAFSQESIKGVYRTVMTSTSYQMDTIYEFGDGNLGGFEYSFAGENQYSAWSWNWEDGRIKAKRFRFKEGGLAMSKEEVDYCLNGSQECVLRSSRDYQILSRDGNRYTMLRQLWSGYDENGQNPEYKNLSIWTFYKR